METATSAGRLPTMDSRADEDEGSQAETETVSFEFNRMTVARFRETFPRARWSESLQSWTVPGTTVRRRIDRWLETEAARRNPFEEERGRDAYEFEPILSPYLSVYDRGFRISTPYSKDDALIRLEVRDAYRALVGQGWTDAVRELHPGERIYTLWDYFRNAYGRDAGLRLDQFLISPDLAKRLVKAGVDKHVRGWELTSDHAPCMDRTF